MNYERLLQLAREEAIAKAVTKWPPHLPVERETERKKLVVLKYLEYISPIVVDEAE